ncbi:MAG: hypothetical protein AAF957_16735 [Planctomycetota bacterium]
MRLLAETLVALAALAPPVSSQTWAVRFDGSTNGGVLDAAMRSDGSIAVLHRNGFDARLSLLDASGSPLERGRVMRFGAGIALTSADDVAIAGASASVLGARLVADPAGGLIWSDQQVPVAAQIVESFYQDVIRTTNDDLVWVGWKASDDSDRQLIVERTTAQGTLVWSRALGDTQQFFAGGGVTELASGDLLVVGSSQFFRPFALVLDGAGSFRALHAFAETGAYDAGARVAATDDGGALMVAGQYAPGDAARVRKLDSMGQPIWDRSYPGPAREVTVDVAGTPGGGGIVLGTSESFGNGSTDLRLLFLDADGDVLRQVIYGTDEDLRASSLRVTAAGDLLVGGRVRVGGEWRGVLLRLAPDGSQAGCAGFPSWTSPVDVPPGTSAPSAMPVVTSYPTAAGADVVPLAVEPTSFVCLSSEVGTSYCSPATANSTGVPATIAARGSSDVADAWVVLSVSSLPSTSFGYFLASQGAGVSSPPIAQGDLCLNGAPIARYSADPFFSGSSGAAGRAIDVTAIPGLGPVQTGSTWNFQAWYRDANPNSTSNFSDARSIAF